MTRSLPPPETIGELLDDLTARRVSLDFSAEDFRLLAAEQERQRAVLGYKPAMRVIIAAALHHYVGHKATTTAGKRATRSKLTADTRRAILEALAAGATRKEAAEAAGVTYATLNNWCHSDIYFFDACQKMMIKYLLGQLHARQRGARDERTPEQR